MNPGRVHGSAIPFACHKAMMSVAASSTTLNPSTSSCRMIAVLPAPGAPFTMYLCNSIDCPHGHHTDVMQSQSTEYATSRACSRWASNSLWSCGWRNTSPVSTSPSSRSRTRAFSTHSSASMAFWTRSIAGSSDLVSISEGRLFISWATLFRRLAQPSRRISNETNAAAHESAHQNPNPIPKIPITPAMPDSQSPLFSWAETCSVFIVQVVCQSRLHASEDPRRDDAVYQCAQHQPAEPNSPAEKSDRLNRRMLSDSEFQQRIAQQENSQSEERQGSSEEADQNRTPVSIWIGLIWVLFPEMCTDQKRTRGNHAQRILNPHGLHRLRGAHYERHQNDDGDEEPEEHPLRAHGPGQSALLLFG